MDRGVRCGSNYSGNTPHFELYQLNTILLDSSTTRMPSPSETSKSLKINKEETLRNLFTV